MTMRQTLWAVILTAAWALSPIAAADSEKSRKLTGEAVMAGQPHASMERLQHERIVLIQDSRENGEVSSGMTVTYVLFEHPPERVFGFLAATQRQVEYRPELTAIEEIERHASGTTDEHRLRILFQRFAYRIRYHIDPEAMRMEWELDPRFDNDLAGLVGFWELYPLEGGRTLGRSGARVDVGPALPSFLQDWITRKNLPQSMERVRQWVDSGGSYRP